MPRRAVWALAQSVSKWAPSAEGPAPPELVTGDVYRRLAKVGLRYEDLYIETADVKLALSRLPKEALVAREQRLMRAMDISMKHKFLPDHIAQLHLEQSVSRSYLAPHVEAIKAAKNEKFLAPGSIGNPYDWSP
ncbi:cytochrome b-c1 complex subunit 7 [Pavlovales sp. CCMP2436]|nr:cytochrome b-c1 complex subunit 7 [Pavlovales sp. CCMP2436]